MRTLTLFLCGDVMTGRGIDQVLPHPSAPGIHEPFARSAIDYLRLAERANGPIPRPVDFAYIWGDAVAEVDRRAPDHRVCNLETSITTSDDAEPKGINYRMHPGNAASLVAAGFDCCSLANNHVLDWGIAGLVETTSTLRRAGIATAGAGSDAEAASRPAVLERGPSRLLVFGMGSVTSGIPPSWRASHDRPGVRLLPDLSPGTADRAAEGIRSFRRPGDIVVVSIHWGENWGYEIPESQREFAHRLIDTGQVDVIHGHSSHHPKGIECYRDRTILYGCGDFLNDYEGIAGHEEYRSDLVLAYFVTLQAGSGRLVGLEMVPFRTSRFRLERVVGANVEWLRGRLDRECEPFGGRVRTADGLALALSC